jgi:type II secretory pathway pseudopilin PulG
VRALTMRTASGRCSRKAFTILEAVISTIIVAVMLVAALSAVGASRLIQHQTALAERGRLLAESLMSEVLQHDYQDPNKPIVFGPEVDEATATRADFDDVDDYHGWSSSPPTAKDGTPLANSAGWRRTAKVEWVEPKEPSQIQGSENGAKCITVTAGYNNVPQATLVAIRTARE